MLVLGSTSRPMGWSPSSPFGSVSPFLPPPPTVSAQSKCRLSQRKPTRLTSRGLALSFAKAVKKQDRYFELTRLASSYCGTFALMRVLSSLSPPSPHTHAQTDTQTNSFKILDRRKTFWIVVCVRALRSDWVVVGGKELPPTTTKGRRVRGH